MAKYETINVTPKSKTTIDRLAKKHNKSLVNFVSEMAIYFDKTGVNPNDMNILSPAEELKKFRDTIISFLRTQEKEFILPVFSRVDSLAAKFIHYIEEEAPKRTDGNKSLKGSIIQEMAQQGKEGNTEKVSLKIPTQDDQTNSVSKEEYTKLKNEFDTLNLKYSTIKEYFGNVLHKVEEKSTGLAKKPVIDLPMADINEYKQYLKRF